MEIRLDPDQGFITEDGKFDQRKALKNAGVKAAVCFKNPKDGEVITPWDIREDSERSLIVRGINTVISDHTTPTEHQTVGLEIVGIPKLLCMVLNNEQFYTSDERSLRYTAVEPNNIISELEVRNYRKWVGNFTEIITRKYFPFFRRFNKSDEDTHKAIVKLAQENARYQVSIFMPTTLTYTVPFIQINKLCKFMERVIDNPLNEIESLLVPYMKDFIKQLKDLNVLIVEDDFSKLLNVDDYSKLVERNPYMRSYIGSDKLVYKNNKNLDLSLFADRHVLSGINFPNQYGPNFSVNKKISIPCYAQGQRHRTENMSLKFLNEFNFIIPDILNGYPDLQIEWAKDMMSVQQFHPQGQLVLTNINSSVERLINYVATERCCDRAQLEIEKLVMGLIKEIYDNLVISNQNELANEVKPYVNKLRCQFPNYNCPNRCGHPRIERDL